MNKRGGKRINIRLEVLVGSRCTALTKNISESGIYVKSSCIESVKPGAEVSMVIKLPSGKSVNLACKKIWSNTNTANGFIEHVGLQIVNPPEKFTSFYHRLRLKNFKWH